MVIKKDLSLIDIRCVRFGLWLAQYQPKLVKEYTENNHSTYKTELGEHTMEELLTIFKEDRNIIDI